MRSHRELGIQNTSHRVLTRSWADHRDAECQRARLARSWPDAVRPPLCALQGLRFGATLQELEEAVHLAVATPEHSVKPAIVDEALKILTLVCRRRA